jgi:very-short-patch-repair endonuclease
VRSPGPRPASPSAFRLRLVIGHHNVDFGWPQAVRLAVEVDGSAHGGRLHSLGWEVLRVSEHGVVADVPGVVKGILAVLGAPSRVGR